MHDDHCFVGMTAARDVDLFFMGNRKAKQRLDEVDRIVRWSRIAPPFGARAKGGSWIEQDASSTLLDSWAFEPGDTWDKRAWSKTVVQGAPARVTRGGLPLPVVVAAAGGNGSWTPVPLALQPCASPNGSSTGAAQQFVSHSGGTWTHMLPSGALSCIAPGSGSSSGAVVVDVAPCVQGSSSQEFNLNPDGLLRSFSSSSDCVAALNCTTMPGTGGVVECLSGSPLLLMTCDPANPGQLWTTTTTTAAAAVRGNSSDFSDGASVSLVVKGTSSSGGMYSYTL